MKDLYDIDFYSWTQKQAELLRAGRLSELDLDNILEEIESMERSDYRALQSRLGVLFMHLLKWQYQPERPQTSNRRERTITEQRKQIKRILRSNPGLKHKLNEMLTEAYTDAIEDAHDETGLPTSTFPRCALWFPIHVMPPDFSK